MAEAAKKHLLILGGGYAGMTIARFLEKRADKIGWEIVLINRDNFFLFTPMLGEVATGSIETRHIINPIRQLCRRIRFEEREILAINTRKKVVNVRQEATGREEGVAYNKLVIALGSATNFFNIPGLKENAITMKGLGDAIYVRNHIISLFEQADTEKYPQIQAPLVTFIVVGGGFAGVELAGELNDFAHYLSKYYPYVDSSLIRVVLVEAASRLLLEVGEDLAEFALQTLKEKGMEVRLSARVKEARPDRIILESGEEILTRTLIWTAGVVPQPLVSALPFQKDKRGRIVVNEFLQSVDDPDVWVVGDCCSLIDPRTGQPYPPTAQHALRQGKRAAQNILAELTGGKKRPFHYNMLGQMAMLGRRSGVAIILGFRVKGFWAWWIWRTYYLFRLPRLAKKLRVMLDWTIDLFFERDIAQLKPYHHRPVT